jgi:hypothetical protein
MIIRALREDDIPKLHAIWKKHYANEFLFPDFLKHFLHAFLAEDEDGQIITAGGVRVLSEAVLITDKDKSPITRYKALCKMLHVAEFVANSNKFDQLHAFVRDETWERTLQKHDFHECANKAFVLEL